MMIKEWIENHKFWVILTISAIIILPLSFLFGKYILAPILFPNPIVHPKLEWIIN